MTSIKVEAFDASTHKNHMPEVAAPDTVRNVLVVQVGKFQLAFLTLSQLESAIAHFRSPSGSTRLSATNGEHWEFQPWQSRLPAGINNSHHRPKVLTALLAARPLAKDALP